METIEECSNIVTPPDFIDGRVFSVLLIDPTQSEIENVAFYLKTAADVFTVYVYCVAMNNREWLHAVMGKVSATIINTVQNEDSPHKDRLAAKAGEIYHYGEKTFLMSQNRRIESPVDYFVNNLTQGK